MLWKQREKSYSGLECCLCGACWGSWGHELFLSYVNTLLLVNGSYVVILGAYGAKVQQHRPKSTSVF